MGLAASNWAVTAVAGGVLGLVIGSFLNVVVYRVPRHLSILHPPSHCPSCQARLGGVDLVPVLSWVALRGRCRRCRAPISWRYPLVELATGALFAGMAAALRWADPLPSIALTSAAALVAAIVDADGAAVPAAVAWAGALGAASLIAVSLALGQDSRLGWAAGGAVLAGCCSLLAQRLAGTVALAPLLVVVSLGWSASWLWPPGGALVAGCVMVVAAAEGVDRGRPLPLALVCCSATACLAVAAALARG